MSRAKSILQKNKECWICGPSGNQDLHLHHIFFGSAIRKISDENGFTVWLCPKHHNMSNYSVHCNDDLNKMLKKECQREYERGNTREEFIKLIGKSYLED